MVQPSGSKEPHPLLRDELLKVTATIDLHSASSGPHGDTPPARDGSTSEERRDGDHDVDVYGTMAVRDFPGMYDVTSFYGRSAGSDVR